MADATLMKLHMHNHTMVIYIQYKFHELPSIGYLVMAEDGKTDIRIEKPEEPSAFGGGSIQSSGSMACNANTSFLMMQVFRIV